MLLQTFSLNSVFLIPMTFSSVGSRWSDRSFWHPLSDCQVGRILLPEEGGTASVLPLVSTEKGTQSEFRPGRLAAACPMLKTFCRVAFSGFEEGDSPVYSGVSCLTFPGSKNPKPLLHLLWTAASNQAFLPAPILSLVSQKDNEVETPFSTSPTYKNVISSQMDID